METARSSLSLSTPWFADTIVKRRYTRVYTSGRIESVVITSGVITNEERQRKSNEWLFYEFRGRGYGRARSMVTWQGGGWIDGHVFLFRGSNMWGVGR